MVPRPLYFKKVLRHANNTRNLRRKPPPLPDGAPRCGNFHFLNYFPVLKTKPHHNQTKIILHGSKIFHYSLLITHYFVIS
jgi:phosphoribosyl 1,2-cyclic phosphodiesterase